MQTAKESVRVLHSLLTRRKRFTHGAGNNGLDIAYITDRVIVCSFPFELPLFFNKNNAGELLKFLEATHKDHYKVYNLCAERKYDAGKFKGRVIEFPVNINEAPQLYTIYSFIKDVNSWLDSDPMNVVCVHCDTGRDRTGMVVSSWLLQTKRCLTASHAITFFASVRGGISPCVTIPSQRRYVEYVERVLTEKMPAIKLVVLEKITIYTVPMFNLRGGCSPWFSISKLNKSIFYSKSLEGRRGKMTIDFECNFIQLQGDIVITFFDGKFSRLMFRISFHSSFIRGKTVTFYPRDIDGPHADVNHKNFHPEFKVTLHFASVSLLPSEQISADDVVPQSKKYSFDDILNTPTLWEAFRAYLVEYRCSENVDFWKNVQRYKACYVPSIAKPIATKMYNKYILRHAPEEVNISHEARLDVEAGVEMDVPPQNVFALAEKEIYQLMRNDSYPRFIISDLFFKACAELSDYASNSPGTLPASPPSSPSSTPSSTPLSTPTSSPASSRIGINIRPYANSAPQGVATEKQPVPKRFPTNEPSSSSGGAECSSPFKMIDEKMARSDFESRRNEAPRSRNDETKEIRRVHQNSDVPRRDHTAKAEIDSKPRSASEGRNEHRTGTGSRNNAANHDGVSRKHRDHVSPRKDRDHISPRKEREHSSPRKVRDHSSPRQDRDPVSPRREQEAGTLRGEREGGTPRGERDHSARREPELSATRKEPEQGPPTPRKDPPTPRNELKPTATPRKEPLTKKEQMEVKKEFLSSTRPDTPLSFGPSLSSNSRIYHTEGEKRGDFIKGDYRSPRTEKDEFDKMHNYLDLSPVRRLSSTSSEDVSKTRSSPEPSNMQTLRSLKSSNKAISQSSPELPLYANSQSLSPQGRRSDSDTPPNLNLSQPQASQKSKHSVTWEDPESPYDPQEFENRRPPSPMTMSTLDIVDPHLLKKNVSQQLQSLVPIPLAHSASAPSIYFPQEINESHDRPATPTAFVSAGRKLSSNSANQYKFPRLPPPPRPETPSSSSVLSFGTPHETQRNNSTNTHTEAPSTYPSPIFTPTEQADTLQVVENVKLVCVECRKQIGNKDVVVSFMHHYYHWGCVKCHKCHQALSSDCVISGDKPFCGKCEDSFFNKCTSCGLSITETAEEQRMDDDGTLHCWHRRCFACSVCGTTSNSECPIDRYQGDRKLYCVFHHPEPRSVPVMSAQDSRDNVDDPSEYSPSPCDDDESDDEDSPPPSPPQSPTPGATPVPSSILTSPPLPLAPLPLTPIPLAASSSVTATRRLTPNKPLPAPPVSTAKPPTTYGTLPRTPSKPLPTPTPLAIPATPPPSSSSDNAKPRRSSHKPLPPLPPMRPTVVSAPVPSHNSPHKSTSPTITPAPIAPIKSTGAKQTRFQPEPETSYFPGSCAACSGLIPKSSQLLLAGGTQYHPACFACSVCATPITGTYQEHEGAVFCARHPVHVYARTRLRCAACEGTIAPGKYLEVGSDKYHIECFGCKLCGLQFGAKHSYYDLWGGHICLTCYESSMRLRNKTRMYKR